ITKPGHPYAGWLSQRIDDTYTHICVETADELTDDNTPRITRAGQERHGDRGAIGGNRMPIIGFLNEARLTVLREQLATATNNADIARAAHAEADRALENFRTQRRQHKALLDLTWEDLDPTPTQQRLDDLTERITTIENGSTSLTEIDQRYRDCLNAADAAKKEAGSLAAQRRTIENDIENISELKDRWLTATEKQERAGQTLTDEQRNYLDELLAADGPNARERDQFENATNRIRRTLTEARTRAEEEAERARADLLRIFSDYLSKWPNNNLAPELEAYPDFLDILHRLDAHGVEERRRAWAAQIMQWIGEHIYAMIREFQIASDAIEERLTPIQTVLDTLPFSIRANRLRIRANYAPASEVPRFQKQLRVLAENMTATTETLDDEALVTFAEAQFARATHLLAQVREKTPAGADNRVRDQLLDVRTHHIFSADEVDAEGNVVMNYNNIAGKSGGESQELIAFITGAALRYQLGDDNRARPVFAPVILDEAFIKADSMTSHRGAEAWPRLGFQPIVVAPEGSFNALEPHFDQLVAVTKDPEGHSSIHMLTDAERAHVREGE
ncbi:SbcC/MukB-like Walker B domain-containing protein, partial [Dermatophilus congolensis]